MSDPSPGTPAGNRTRYGFGLLLAVALVFGGALLLWSSARRAEAPTRVAARGEPARSPAREPARESEVAVPPAEPQLEVAADGVPILAARGDSTEQGPRHPHPITAEHRRIFEENALLGSLDGAMDVKDYEGLRQLNEEYKARFPDDPQQLQAGYDLIADCLEARTEQSRARAERYFAEQRASTLRRYVKRYCLP